MPSEDVRSLDAEENRWLRETYQPGVKQLTIRAVIFGMVIGGVMCLSNLYVFFKTGWSMGVTITAAILAFSTFNLLRAIGVMKKPLTLLENNALTTVASGAGYMTGGGNMAALGALLMVTTVRPDLFSMMIWFAVIAALGVFTAIPIKRQLINKEALVFPTGTATAETLKVLHSSRGAGAGEGQKQAKALGFAALIAGLVTWFRDAKASWMPGNIASAIEFPFKLAGHDLARWSLSLKTELVQIGAGALMSFRTCWSMLLGSILTFAFWAPALVKDGVVREVTFKSIVGFTTWPGAAIMVASGLTSFALDWRSVARSFRGLGGLFTRKKVATSDPMDAIECPGTWFPLGYLVLSPIVILLMTVLFQIPWWAGLIAIPLAVVMGFVGSRVTGETDVTPTKALGPVTQLVYGGLTPGNLSGNIMAANVTAGIGLHAADLLTTLKTGWLLGANPRVQFFAQLFGVAAGAAIVVPAFNIIVDDPKLLGGETWPAPSCVVWANVSKVVSDGFGALHSAAHSAILVGIILGIALALLEKFAPPRIKRFVPSPSGLGLSMVLTGATSIAMFVGSLAALLIRKWNKPLGDRYVTPVASGFIAGESLIGVLIALLISAGYLAR